MQGGDHPMMELLDRLGPSSTPGNLGMLMSAPGVGKTGFLSHVALHALLEERKVLHVAIGMSVDHVRAHYDEVLRASTSLSDRDLANVLVRVERNRMVLSHPVGSFDVAHLFDQVSMLAGVAEFRPDLLIVDGLTPEQCRTANQGIRSLAARIGAMAWVSATLSNHDEGVGLGNDATFVLELRDEGGDVCLYLGGDRLPWYIDPVTQVLVDPSAPAVAAKGDVPVLTPSACTLYSGGAAGAEAWFGEQAARYGVHEVSFTFEGHKQAREVGAKLLSMQELEAGDVSLVYVSRRLNRSYAEKGLIRKVLQTLWHMVSRAQQVFVVGAIQDDGTVVGGTGWSVELAKMWHKDVWVYDQVEGGWFTWKEGVWVPGEARITSTLFCGTGTRYLKENGKLAVAELFAEAFAEQVAG